MLHVPKELTAIRGVLDSFKGKELSLLTIHQPPDLETAVFHAKVISKLTPIIGNFLEQYIARELSTRLGGSRRQDPGFPDVVLELHSKGKKKEIGIEIKAWYPLATEAAARFKVSQRELVGKSIYLALVAWVPSKLIYGDPLILDVLLVDALDVARKRDLSYHRPLKNIVVEPVDTSKRKANLQQRVVIGKTLQTDELSFDKMSLGQLVKQIAKRYNVRKMKVYSIKDNYIAFVREIEKALSYREDSNFGKIDRIPHKTLSEFIAKTKQLKVNELPLTDWGRVFKLLSDSDPAQLEENKEWLTNALRLLGLEASLT